MKTLDPYQPGGTRGTYRTQLTHWPLAPISPPTPHVPSQSVLPANSKSLSLVLSLPQRCIVLLLRRTVNSSSNRPPGVTHHGGLLCAHEMFVFIHSCFSCPSVFCRSCLQGPRQRAWEHSGENSLSSPTPAVAACMKVSAALPVGPRRSHAHSVPAMPSGL